MPLIRKPAGEPETHRDLVRELAQEIDLDQPEGPSGAPTIIEEAVRGSPHIHVTVIWDRWAPIPADDRGRVILDAYTQARGEQEMLKISVALGVTVEESRRLGIAP